MDLQSALVRFGGFFMRRTRLKAAIYSRFPTARAFLERLETNGVELSEIRLSKIITGHVTPRPEECRHIAWALQASIRELFPTDGESRQ